MDESVYSLLVFNNVFGSGMSSRLFQNIREQRGLVYSISAGHSAYINTGVFDISAGMSPESLGEVAHLISKEINTIKRNQLTSAEITKAKEQLKGNYILSSESTGARMQGAGRSLLLNKPIYTQEEALKNRRSKCRFGCGNNRQSSRQFDYVFQQSDLSITLTICLNSIK